MKIIDDRDERTRNRKLKKKEYDEMMTLSAKTEQWARLLDEGTITYAGGEAYLYIAKGTLRAFYDSLDPKYVGSVNVGHTDIETFPERIIGEWTKKDLRLVDIGDGREALDVRMRLYQNHPVVEALKLAPFELGISAEFYPHFNENMTKNETLNPLGVPVIDGVEITDYAVVGDAGNVSSMGVKLKGETMVDVKKLGALLDEEGKKSIEDMNVMLSALENEAEEAGEAGEAKAPAGEAKAPAGEAKAPKETTKEAGATEEAEATAEGATEKAPVKEAKAPEEEATDTVKTAETVDEEAAQAVLTELVQELTSLREENANLREQLASKDAAWAEFSARLKKMAVVKTDKKKPEVKAKVQYTDGIGE